MRTLNQKGVTLVELLIAVGILAIITGSVMATRAYVAKQTQRNSDKAFATQKAVLMVEELKTLVAGEEKLGSSTLIDRADGATVYNPILTTDPAVTNPADPLSQNRVTGSGWHFLRHIDIAGLPSDANGSIVTVRVFSSRDGVTPGEELSNVTTVLRSIATTFPPSQVMDVYILALSNIQGWWIQLTSMRQTFDSVLSSLQTENPGLVIRSHYITRTSYGRDPYYFPYINNSSNAANTSMDWAYFYPGSVNDDSGNGTFYFSPNLLPVSGNVLEDGTPIYTSNQFSGCPSYSVCDMYDHAQRYPDELATYQAVTQAAAAAGQAIPEISLRMLMEGMYSQPANFTNAMVLNLHGELLPSPAMRNYSDPAKDPANHPFQRVVTHPENLQYASGANVNLRVYGYLDGLSDPTTLDSILTSDARATATTVTVLLDQIISPATISVTAIWGSDAVTYGKASIPQNSATIQGMQWFATNVGSPPSQTLITLVNTPLRCPLQTGLGGGGLKALCRLYGLEYIPCPISTSFSQDLTDTSASNNHPKNTARWIIKVPGLTDGQHSIETRIGGYPSAFGASLSDLSRTYVWVNSTPPITEQYQFLGDPRHCPYLDVKNNMGYNWYFRQIVNSPGTNYDGYTGFTNTTNGWGQDADERDVPRYFQVWRKGLLKSHAIWTTMNGFSYYYMGQGGEFGSDQAPFTNGINFIRTPWSTSLNNTAATVDEILPSHATIQQARVIAGADNKWVSKYWLGELYPDAFYSTWAASGNLPTFSNANSMPTTLRFYRAQYGTFGNYSYGAGSSGGSGTGDPTCSGFQRGLAKRTNSTGCIAFMNGVNSSNSSKTFCHTSTSVNGALQSLGTYCYPIFFFGLGDPVLCTRPWSLNYNTSGTMPTEWNTAPYNSAAERTTLSISAPTSLTSRIFYSSPVTTGGGFSNGPFYASAVVRSDLGVDSAFFVFSGLAVQANFGPFELGKSALIFLLRTFLDGGQYSGNQHITQLPYVDLVNPPQAAQLNNPSSVPITYTSAWKRWNGTNYTEEYSSGYNEAGVTVQYNLKYSKDDGSTWQNVSDDTAAQLGVLDVSHAVTTLTGSWDVSNTTNFPRGNYTLRVEAFRPNLPLHYSFHQTNLYINR